MSRTRIASLVNEDDLTTHSVDAAAKGDVLSDGAIRMMMNIRLYRSVDSRGLPTVAVFISHH